MESLRLRCDENCSFQQPLLGRLSVSTQVNLLTTQDTEIMSRWIDVSVPLSASTPVWPGNPRFSAKRHRSIADGDMTNDTHLAFDCHTGTHVEGLMHVDSNGAGPDSWPADLLITQVVVVEIDPKAMEVSATDVPATPASFTGLLFKTSNSTRNLWANEEFQNDFCGLIESAAQATAAQPHLNVVGIDYMSIQSPLASIAVHKTLLENSIAIIEGLDLRYVDAGDYEMICLPLLLSGSEASPCRVLLRSISYNAEEAGVITQ